MCKWIKKTGIMLMLLVFFTSTTGFTVYIHVCSCLNTSKQHIFNELFKSKPVCCCERETNTNTEYEGSNEHYTNSACCQNNHFLVKSFSYLPPLVIKLSNDQLDKSLFCSVIKKLNFSQGNDLFIEKLSYHYHPPPLIAGKQLIIFYNQIKIPLPV